MYITFY